MINITYNIYSSVKFLERHADWSQSETRLLAHIRSRKPRYIPANREALTLLQLQFPIATEKRRYRIRPEISFVI